LNQENQTPEKCGICFRPCCGLAINNTYLCDAHFEVWLKWPRDERQGAQQRMSEFMADQRAQTRRTA